MGHTARYVSAGHGLCVVTLLGQNLETFSLVSLRMTFSRHPHVVYAFSTCTMLHQLLDIVIYTLQHFLLDILAKILRGRVPSSATTAHVQS